MGSFTRNSDMGGGRSGGGGGINSECIFVNTDKKVDNHEVDLR